MFIVHFKGGSQQMEVTHDLGLKILNLIETGADQETPVRIAERMFRLSTIKEIVPVAEPRSSNPLSIDLPLTSQEREQRDRIIAQTRTELEKKGVLKMDRHNALRASWQEQGLPIYSDCVICHKSLPPYYREFCSTLCRLKPQEA